MSRGALVLASALAAGACNHDYPNPLDNPQASATPAPDADLLIVGNQDTGAGTGRSVYALRADGEGLSRLNTCSQGGTCDTPQAVLSPDRLRLAARRISADSNGDGRLTPADDASLALVALERSLERPLLPATAQIQAADWSPAEDLLVYSALGSGGLEDLYVIQPDGSNNRNLTQSPVVRERSPRIDPSGAVVVYEHIDAAGKGEIWIYNSQVDQKRVTSGGAGSAPLPGTPYVVGADADPAYSPDGGSVVFRRLTGLGSGQGDWDILSVAIDGSHLVSIASGPGYRGAPDWGPQGIAFVEAGPTGAQLVAIAPDGSGRKQVFSVGPGLDIAAPRWLR